MSVSVLVVLHGVLMAAAWAVLLPTGALCARFNRGSSRKTPSAGHSTPPVSPTTPSADAIASASSGAALVPVAPPTPGAPAPPPAPPAASPPTWWTAHWTLQSTGAWVTVLGAILAVAMVQSERGGAHFASTHAKLGLAVVLLGVSNALGGVFRVHDKTSAWRPWWRLGHVMLGSLALALALAAIPTGLQASGAGEGLIVFG